MSNDGGGKQAPSQPSKRSYSWEPPGGLARAAGGLLGVVAGEALGLTRQGWADRASGPIAQALTDLARGYDSPPSGRLPVGVAERCQGIPAPAWLLAAAVALPDRRGLVADTLELATLAGVPRHALPACVAYVELAAGLFAGQPAEAAIRSGVGAGIAPNDVHRAAPPLCGESAVDAWTAGVWALVQPGDMAPVMDVLGALSTPGVGAAVAGLLGLRDGCGALPPAWHRPAERASESFALAAGLVRARCHRPRGAVAAKDLEAEASKERAPGEAATGVGVPTASGAAVRPSRGGRTGCGQRQLEGAGSR